VARTIIYAPRPLMPRPQTILPWVVVVRTSEPNALQVVMYATVL